MTNFCILSSIFFLTILPSIFGRIPEQLVAPAPAPTPDDADVRFTTTKSGRKLHDDFYKLIEAQEPVESALNQALTWDVEAQYEHFELLNDHVQAGDKYAKYCADVIKAAQDLLDVTLKKIRIDRKVKIFDYIKGLYDFESARPITPEMQEIVSGINDYRNAVVKKLEEEQERAKREAANQTQAEPQEVSQPTAQDEKATDEQTQAESQAVSQPEAQDENQVDEESDDDEESETESQNISTTSMGI